MASCLIGPTRGHELAVRIGDVRIRSEALEKLEQTQKLKSGEISEGG